MKTGSLFAELKRRKVYRVAVAYGLMGWALAQGIAQVFPVFQVPNCTVRLIMVLIALGFPIALVLAWLFELTPEGLKRTVDISPHKAPHIDRELEARARQQFVRGYLCALIYAGLGDKTKAIDYLQREYLNHNDIDITGVQVDTMLDARRSDHQFETLADNAAKIRAEVDQCCGGVPLAVPEVECRQFDRSAPQRQLQVGSP
jgi:hypothetical protein